MLHTAKTAAIAFVDATLPDLETLLAALAGKVETHLLNRDQDGLVQIADYLDGKEAIPALHLIAHGAPGQLFLGNSTVDREKLQKSRDEIAVIANALVEDGELLIYGCEVAAGRKGRLFVDALTDMTGLKVAAATHKVGHERLGGNWELDVIGEKSARQLRVSDWNGLLVNLTSVGSVSPYASRWGGTAIDASGNLYVLFTGNSANTTRDLYVYKWNGSTFEAVGPAQPSAITSNGSDIIGASTADVMPLEADIQVATDGTLYVSIKTSTNGVGFWKYESGGPWTQIGAAAVGQPTGVTQQDMEIIGSGPNETIYEAVNATTGIKVGRFTTTDGTTYAWTDVGGLLPDSKAPGYDTPDLELAPDGTPYVAYLQATTQKMLVAKFDGTSWVNVGVVAVSTGSAAGSLAAGDQYDLEIASDGTPYVMFKDAANTVSNSLTVAKFDGAIWTTVGNAGFTPNAPMNGRMTLDETGTPYVSYNNAANLAVVSKFDGASWVDLGQTSATTYYPQVAVGGGKIWVAGQKGWAAPYTINAWTAVSNAAPTLTTVSTLAGGTEDTGKTITFADLQVAGNEADSDGTVTAFEVQAVTTGTLTINGAAYNASTNKTIDASKSAIWTPDANANGTALNAFTVKAKDSGAALSATAVQVKVDVATVADAPLISGIDSNDNHSFVPGTPTYLEDSNLGEGYAFVTNPDVPLGGSLNGGYLTVNQTAGTTNGTFSFDNTAYSATTGLSGTDAVLAGTAANALKTDGSLAVGDKVYSITVNSTPSLPDVILEIGTVVSSGANGGEFKVAFTTTDATFGTNATNPGTAGFLVRFLMYDAPTSGARTFSVVVNDGISSSTAKSVTLAANDTALPVVDLNQGDNGTLNTSANVTVGGPTMAFASGTTHLTDTDSTEFKALKVDIDSSTVRLGDKLVLGSTNIAIDSTAASGTVTYGSTDFAYTIVDNAGTRSIIFTSQNGSHVATPASIAAYESLLNALSFMHTGSESSGTRSFSVNVTDAGDNVAVTAANFAVTLLTDSIAPSYQSASISGTTLTLGYDEALSSTLPATGTFTLKVNGQEIINGITGVAINGSDNTKLNLTLASPVYFGQTVTISYTDPNSGNDPNVLQDMAGNDAASFVDYGVANTTVATSSVVIGSQLQGEQVRLAIGGGLSINAPTNSAAPTNLGKSLKMPLGQFAFNITGLQNGGSAQLSMTADADLKQLTYYKWNYLTSKYTNIAKSVSIDQANNKATVFFDLVDGGAYDADRTANGTIVDPGGAAENKLLPVIYENESAVGFVTPLNPDQVNGTLSYAITGGADAGKFSINRSTGALSFQNAPNFEVPNDQGDTAGNNTYAVTITVTGSNGGSEIQPLIVNVMNVPEAGDPTVGSNVSGEVLTETVNAPPSSGGNTGDGGSGDSGSGGTGSGDSGSGGTGSGDSGSGGTGSGDSGSGSTGTGNTGATGGTSTTTVDGATVTTGTTTVNNQVVPVLNVVPVSENRQESTGDGSRADIALFYSESNMSVPATTASLPVGVGLTSTGARVPTNNQEALNNLIALVNQTAGNTENNRTDMVQGGQSFLNRLDQMADKGPLIINSVKLTVAPNQTTAPDKPITITGSTARVTQGNGNGNGGAPVEAIVIDTRSLPPGTVLELKDIEFAVIVGDNVTVRGGAGANIVFAGSGPQNIVLGEDDDALSGGDGDDIIGSTGGNDLINGDAGNDWLVGGVGNDTVNGGAGNDLLHGGASDAGTYRFTLNAEGKVRLDWSATHADMAAAPSTVIDGQWWNSNGNLALSDARFGFVAADGAYLQDVAVLYQAVLKQLPTVGDLNFWAKSGVSSSALAQLAYEAHLAQQGPGAQALEVQMAQLIQSVWGGTADPALVQAGVNHISQGGSWGDALLYLARHANNTQAITDDQGRIKLAKDWTLKETGWSGNGGDDKLNGGAGNDVLVAGSGNNILDGGSGVDLAVFFGSVNDWQIVLNEAQQVVVSNRYSGAQNVIRDIELLQFGDTVFGQVKPEHPVIVTGVKYAITDFFAPATAGQVAIIGVTDWAVV